MLETVPIYRPSEGFARLRVPVIQKTVDGAPQRAIPLRALHQWQLADVHAQALPHLPRDQSESHADRGHEAKPRALVRVVQGKLETLVHRFAFAYSFSIHRLPPPVVRCPAHPFRVRRLELLIVGVRGEGVRAGEVRLAHGVADVSGLVVPRVEESAEHEECSLWVRPAIYSAGPAHVPIDDAQPCEHLSF